MTKETFASLSSSSFTLRFLALPLRVKGSVAAQAKVTKRYEKKKILSCGDRGSDGFIIKGEA